MTLVDLVTPLIPDRYEVTYLGGDYARIDRDGAWVGIVGADAIYGLKVGADATHNLGHKLSAFDKDFFVRLTPFLDESFEAYPW